jgi:hypothetical protein
MWTIPSSFGMGNSSPASDSEGENAPLRSVRMRCSGFTTLNCSLDSEKRIISKRKLQNCESLLTGGAQLIDTSLESSYSVVGTFQFAFDLFSEAFLIPFWSTPGLKHRKQILRSVFDLLLDLESGS